MPTVSFKTRDGVDVVDALADASARVFAMSELVAGFIEKDRNDILADGVHHLFRDIWQSLDRLAEDISYKQ